MNRTGRTLVPAFLLLFWGGSVLPLLHAEDAASLVREGIERFRKGDYEGAGKAFAEADVARPEDPRITFDRACVLAGKNDLDKAMDLFRTAALSRDPVLAAAARYNLGCLFAEKARSLFGKQPEAAEPGVRREGLELLFSAVKHYRECLALDPAHEDARYNLELIRLWIKNMQALWEERDREKARREMNLLQFLERIERRQQALLDAARDLAREEDSPRRRQEAAEAAGAQRALAEEVAPLKEKIDAELVRPSLPPGRPAGGGGPPPPAAAKEDRARAAEVLKGWADEAREKMVKAAERLDSGKPGDAVEPQEGVVEDLDRIFGAVAPFPAVLEKARALQEAVRDRTAPFAEGTQSGEAGVWKATAWSEDRVGNLSRILGLKAQEELRGPAPAPGGGEPSPPPAGKGAEASREKRKQALEKAVRLAPEIRKLTGEAAEQLRDGEPGKALPPEEKALELLEEIARDLPEREQAPPKKDEDKKGGEGKNRKQQEPGRSKEPGKQEKEGARGKKKPLTREEAEAILRKAEEREREYRKRREALMRAIRHPAKVDKDW